MFPPIPTWDSLHPIIIHFPIVLLIIAPLFIILGLFFGENGKWFHFTALTLMVLGTIAAFVAVSTGEAAAEFAMRTPQVQAVLEEHEELAETTRMVFTILTVIFATLLILPLALKRPLKKNIAIPSHIAFTVIYSSCLLLLVNTAHEGGRLVHEFGVHAMMPIDPSAQSTSQNNGLGIYDDDDD